MEMLTSLTPGVGYSNGNGISVKTKTSNIISTDIILAYCSIYAVIVFIVLRNRYYILFANTLKYILKEQTSLVITCYW